jgi:hypothetical protein
MIFQTWGRVRIRIWIGIKMESRIRLRSFRNSQTGFLMLIACPSNVAHEQ